MSTTSTSEALTSDTLFGLIFALGRSTSIAGRMDDECEGHGFCADHVEWDTVSKLTRTDLDEWTEGRYA